MASVMKIKVKKYSKVKHSYFHQNFQVPTSRNVVLHTMSNYVKLRNPPRNLVSFTPEYSSFLLYLGSNKSNKI